MLAFISSPSPPSPDPPSHAPPAPPPPAPQFESVLSILPSATERASMGMGMMRLATVSGDVNQHLCEALQVYQGHG